MAVDSEDVQVIEREEVIDGETVRVRRTIRTKVEEEVVIVEEDNSEGSIEQETEVQSEYDEVVDDYDEVPENVYDDPTSELVCQCQTPSGNSTLCFVTDNHDGTYTVDINASEAGVHTVDVELDGRKIPGSPFLVRIVQSADKKKVLLFGAGLSSGLLDEFEGNIHVDTKGAGPGDLKVRLHGPKDGFTVDMEHDPHDNRVVNISYNPTVSGLYTLNVYWSGEHVAGSPAEVYLAPNAELLETWHEEPDKIREAEGLSDKY